MKKAVFLFSIILAAWGIFTLLPLTWVDWPPATCLATTGCFCEAIRPGAVAQPANAWSSLAFVLPGLLVLGWPIQGASTSRDHRLAGIKDSAVLKNTFGLALIVIGLGSAFYHASLTFAGQFMDVLGMYLLLSFAALYGLARLAQIPPRRAAISYLVINLLLVGVLLWLPAIRREVFAGLVGLTLLIELGRVWKYRAQLQVRWLALAFASLGVAYAIWITDNNRWLCAPESWLQGHAIWHVLGALAGWGLFQYDVTEKDLNPGVRG